MDTHSTADHPEAPLPRPPLTLDAAPYVLTAVTEDDWSLEVELSGTADVVAWTYQPAHLDEATARERIAWVRDRVARGRVGRYVVRDAAGVALGTCGVGALATGVPEVFYALLPAARGRGAATSAARALVEWVVSAGYKAVALETIEGNSASERVAERAGFHRVGVHEGEQHGRPVVLTWWLMDLGADALPS